MSAACRDLASVSPVVPWSATADAIEGHILFDAEGCVLVEATELAFDPPEFSVAAAMEQRRTWGLRLAVRLLIRHRHGSSDVWHHLTLPLTTEWGTWVVAGLEVVPRRADDCLDTELAVRLERWLADRATDSGRRASRDPSRLVDGHCSALSCLVDRFLEQVVAGAQPPARNRLAQLLLLEHTGRGGPCGVSDRHTRRILINGLPVAGDHGRQPAWFQEVSGVLPAAGSRLDTPRRALEARLPTVPLRVAVDPSLPDRSAVITAAAAARLQATRVHRLHGPTSRTVEGWRPDDLSSAERAGLDGEGVVRVGTRVEAGQRLLLAASATCYPDAPPEDRSVRAPCAGRVVAVGPQPRTKSTEAELSIRIDLTRTADVEVGDALGVVSGDGPGRIVRVAEVRPTSALRVAGTSESADVLIGAPEGAPLSRPVASVVPLAELRVPAARVSDLPAAILGDAVLAAALLGTTDTQRCEWGPSWSAAPGALPAWTPARRIQNLLAPFGLALDANGRGLGLVRVDEDDLRAVSSPPPVVDGLLCLRSALAAGGQDAARRNRWRLQLPEAAAHPRLGGDPQRVFGLPMLDLFVGGGRRARKMMRAFEALADALAASPGHRRGRSARAAGARLCVGRIWQESACELALLLEGRERLSAGFTAALVASPSALPGTASLSPDLLPQLLPGTGGDVSRVLLAGKEVRSLDLRRGSGTGCVVVHPSDHPGLVSRRIFGMGLATPATIDAARRLEESGPLAAEPCWVDELLDARISGLLDVLGRTVAEDLRVSFRHPTVRRVLGVLDPAPGEGGA